MPSLFQALSCLSVIYGIGYIVKGNRGTVPLEHDNAPRRSARAQTTAVLQGEQKRHDRVAVSGQPFMAEVRKHLHALGAP